MPASVQTSLERFPHWEAGDVVIVNDPFEGGNHLPDITMVSPVFTKDDTETPDFFVASRAHHADVGGMSPGSLPLSTEIYQEGIIIPPIKLYKRGELNEEVLKIILRNVRTPDERRGDLAAQRAAAAVGEQRLRGLVATFGREEVLGYASALQDYSERLTRQMAGWGLSL
jgi:N-methylhydantoinase B